MEKKDGEKPRKALDEDDTPWVLMKQIYLLLRLQGAV